MATGPWPLPLPAAEPEQGEIRLHLKGLSGIFRVKFLQGIGGMGINGDDLVDAVQLQVPGHEPGVLHKALLIPQVVEQDAAVEVHLRMIKEAHAGFRQEAANGLQDAVKFLLLRPGGQEGQPPARQGAGEIAAEAAQRR